MRDILYLAGFVAAVVLILWVMFGHPTSNG